MTVVFNVDEAAYRHTIFRFAVISVRVYTSHDTFPSIGQLKLPAL